MTRTSRPLAALGALLLLNGALLGIPWLAASTETFSETVAMWQYAAFQRVSLVALVALALLLPTLGRLTAPDGRRLAGWVVPMLTVGVLLQAATAYAQGFVAPFLAQVSPAALDVEDGGLFAASMAAAWVIFLVSLVALAVVGFRRRVLPRGACVLLAIGALAVPVLGPIGSILVGAAFGWVGLSPASSAPSVAEATVAAHVAA